MSVKSSKTLNVVDCDFEQYPILKLFNDHVGSQKASVYDKCGEVLDRLENVMPKDEMEWMRYHILKTCISPLENARLRTIFDEIHQSDLQHKNEENARAKYKGLDLPF